MILSRFPIQRNSSPFLLIMCIDAPESTTNSLSSGLIVDGAGRHLFSEGEENAVWSFSFNFMIFLANFHAASRAHRSCHSVSSWDRSSNFGATLMRITWANYSKRWFLSRMLAWRNTALVNWTHRIGFSMFELFRKIDEDFGGSISWNTQPNCRVFFNIATAILSPFVLRLLAWLFVNLAVCVGALIPQFASIFCLVEQALRRMPLFTEWSCASSFEVILARPSSHFPTWTFASRTLGSRCIFHILLRRRSWRRVRWCRFCTLIFSVSETAVVSFRTCPLAFHCQQYPRLLLFTLFYPAILDHGACFKISIFGFKVVHS